MKQNSTTAQPMWTKCRACGFHYEESFNFELREDGIALGTCYNCKGKQVLVEIDIKELGRNNFGWRDCDSPPKTIIVRGNLTDKKETAFMTS